MTRRILTLLIAAGALLAVSTTALAFWTPGGSGRGAAATGTLAPPVVSVPAKSGRAVAVSWDAQATLSGAAIPEAIYRVQRKGPADAAYATLTSGGCAAPVAYPASACTDTVPADGAYAYRVVAVYRSWTATSAVRAVDVVPAPSAPVLAAATATSPAAGEAAGDVELTWNAVAGATGYAVYRAATSQAGAGDPRYTRLDAGGVTATAYTDADLPAEGGTWHYAVKALGPGGASAFSNERATTVIARPPAPRNLTATAAAGGDITLAWDAVNGAEGYRVYRRTAAGAYGDGSPASDAGFRDPGAGLADGERYVYMVRSVAGLESLDSAEAEARSDSRAPAYGAAAVALSGDGGWINAASAADAAVRVDLSGPGEPGDVVGVTVRDGAGAAVTRSAPVTPGAGSIIVSGIDVSPLAEVSSSVADPAAARNLRITATVSDAAGNESTAGTATGGAGKDVTAPPATGPQGLVVTYADGRLTGSGEPFDAVSAAREGDEGTVYDGTVQADGALDVGVGALLTGEAGVFHLVTETDPAGNALTVRFGPFASAG